MPYVSSLNPLKHGEKNSAHFILIKCGKFRLNGSGKIPGYFVFCIFVYYLTPNIRRNHAYYLADNIFSANVAVTLNLKQRTLLQRYCQIVNFVCYQNLDLLSLLLIFTACGPNCGQCEYSTACDHCMYGYGMDYTNETCFGELLGSDTDVRLYASMTPPHTYKQHTKNNN